jgi:hypothetical protein
VLPAEFTQVVAGISSLVASVLVNRLPTSDNEHYVNSCALLDVQAMNRLQPSYAAVAQRIVFNRATPQLQIDALKQRWMCRDMKQHGLT